MVTQTYEPFPTQPIVTNGSRFVAPKARKVAPVTPP